MPSPTPDWLGTPFVKVYTRLQLDHPNVWRSDALLSWYVRLLTLADRAHPVPALRPVAIPDEVYLQLVADGVVDSLDEGAAFTIHGLAKQRATERARGQAGGAARVASVARAPGGRFAPRTSEDQRSPAGDAGSSPPAPPAGETLEPTSEQPAATSDAGPATLVHQRTSDKTLNTEEEEGSLRSPSSSSSPDTNGASARGQLAHPGRVLQAECPNKDHRDRHRWIDDAIRCPVCEWELAGRPSELTRKIGGRPKGAGEAPGVERPGSVF